MNNENINKAVKEAGVKAASKKKKVNLPVMRDIK